jgi:hypothetical protein
MIALLLSAFVAVDNSIYVVAEQCVYAESSRSTSHALLTERDRVLCLARDLSWRNLLILLKPHRDPPHLQHRQDHTTLPDTKAIQTLLLSPNPPPKKNSIPWHAPANPLQDLLHRALMRLALACRSNDLVLDAHEHQFDFAEVNMLAFEHMGAETGDAFVRLSFEACQPDFRLRVGRRRLIVAASPHHSKTTVAASAVENTSTARDESVEDG